MKTKRVFVGGASTFDGSVTRQGASLVLAVAMLGVTALACKSGNNGQENGTPADPGPAAVAQGTDVVRYAGMEVGDSGQAGIRQAVQARRAADWSSTTVATLYPGTVVNRIARYGNYNLVAWTGSGGAQQGWVDSNVAFSTVRTDAGAIQPPTVFGATTINQQPTVTTPPPPVVTTPPPPVATTPPPVATTPPKPAVTVTPPKSTATAPRTGFKPPKLN
jgi:hypothetical protein